MLSLNTHHRLYSKSISLQSSLICLFFLCDFAQSQPTYNVSCNSACNAPIIWTVLFTAMGLIAVEMRILFAQFKVHAVLVLLAKPLCTRPRSIKSTNISVDCSMPLACRHANIMCRIEGLCSVRSTGQNALFGATVDARAMVSGQLDIFASGWNSLSHAEIYCPQPSGDAQCLINVDGNDPDVLIGTRIHAVHGFNDIQINCKNNDCYDPLNPPQMACSNDYGVWCNIGLDSAGIWQCVGNNATSLCNDSTTNGHYCSYFICDQPNECASIFCNDNADCDVKCIETNSCTNPVITAPINGSLQVTCSEWYSCTSAKIKGSIKSTNISVDCSMPLACRHANIMCRIEGLCSVRSTGQNALFGATVDARAMV
eukprot:58662_1